MLQPIFIPKKYRIKLPFSRVLNGLKIEFARKANIIFWKSIKNYS
jgi:hypothetical protein